MPCYSPDNVPEGYIAKFPDGPAYESEEDCLDACAEGACCEIDGTCNIKPQCECDTDNGAVFAGVGATCEDAKGACCKLDGTCEVVCPAGCDTDNGAVFAGAGTTCEDAKGACCKLDGTCAVVCPTGCDTDNGEVFYGAGTTCEDVCDNPVFSEIVVQTQFATVEVSCSNRFAYSYVQCGPAGNSGNEVSVALIPANCSGVLNITPDGIRACDSRLDTHGEPRQAWNLQVFVSRSDVASGGTAESISTYYKIDIDDNGVANLVNLWSGSTLTPNSGCGIPLDPSNPLPDGYIDVAFSRCYPCGTNAYRDYNFSCGLYYGIEPGIDCCDKPLTHTATIVQTPNPLP